MCLLWVALVATPAIAARVRAPAVPAGSTTDLRVVVSDAPDPVQTGQDVTYTINVANQGLVSATGLSVSVFYSGVLTAVPQGTPGWNCSISSIILCNLVSGSLATPGSAPPLQLRFTAPTTPQTVQVNVTATATEPEFSPADNTNIQQSTQVLFADANLTLNVTPSSASAAAGTPISFTANVVNAGPGSAPALQLSGNLNGAIVFSSFSVSSAWNCTHSSGAINCAYQGGSPAGTLAPGVTAAPVVINGIAGPSAGTAQLSLSATSTANDPSPASTSSSISVTSAGQITADLSLSKTVVGAQPIPRDVPFKFRLVVTNSGAGGQTASSIQINDALPAGLSLQGFSGAGWSCVGNVVCNYAPTLAVGQTSTPLDLQVVYGSAVPVGGAVVTNTATVSAAEPDPVSGNNSASASASLRASADLGVQLTGPNSVVAGGAINVDLVALNAGPDSAANVVATGTIASGFTVGVVSGGAGWSCLASGQSVTCQRPLMTAGNSTAASLTLTAPASAGGPFAQSATITSDNFDANGSNNSASLPVTVTAAAASLSFSKRARVSAVALGANAIFDLTVSNTGQVDASGLVIVDDVPAGLDVVSASGDGWTCTIDVARVDCRRPALLRGSSSVVAVEVRPRSAGTYVNRAQLSANGSSTLLANDTLAVNAPPSVADLALELTDSADPVIQGSEFEYRMRVRNLGTASATAVRVSIVIPAGLQSLGSTSSGWTCQSSGTVECLLGGSLAAGAESSLVLRVRATGTGALVTTANVNASESDPVASNNTASESTQIQSQTAQAADLQLTASGPETVVAGNTIEVIAQINNVGPGAAADVLLRAEASSGLSLLSGGGSGFSCRPVSGFFECRGPVLASGGSAVIRLQGQVSAATTGNIEATLAVSASTSDPDASNNTGKVAVRVTTPPPPPPQTADLSITKVDSADPVAFGERYTYTLTARNLGPAAADGVVIRDPLPSGLVFVSAAGTGLVCSGGAAVECRANAALAVGQQLIVTVTVDAPGVSGSISNEATVSSSTSDTVTANNRATQTTQVNAPEGSAAEEALNEVTGGDTLAGEAVPPVVNLCDGAAGEVLAMCNALYRDAAAGRDQEVQDALRSLYPEEVLSQFSSLNQLADTQYFNVDARLSELRAGGGGVSLSGLNVVNGGQSIPIGLLQGLFANADDEPEIGGTGDLISPWGFFVNGSITRGDQQISSTDREVVRDFDSVGITAGVDYRRSARWVLGAALGYNKFKSELTDNGKLDTSGFTLTGYSAYYVTDLTYIDTRLSYGNVGLDQTRRLRANLTGFTLDETLNSDTNARQLTFASSVGHHISRGAWTFTPNAFVRYMKSDVDGFAEDGSSFAVRYGDQSVKSLVFGAGIQVNRVISLSNGVLTPQFDLIWNHESGNDDTVINASYVGGDPGEFFSLRPDAPDKSYGSVGFGLVYILANGKQAFLQWRESIGVDGLSRSSVNLGARFEF